MQKISIYISEETKRIITFIVKAQNKTGSEIIREALDRGLKKLGF